MPVNDKDLSFYDNSKIEIIQKEAPRKSSIWELVKALEDDAESNRKQFGEMVATLIVNYSELNKGRHPVIISSKDSPIAMLIKVLQYYHEKQVVV
jgi:hypothetical protein